MRPGAGRSPGGPDEQVDHCAAGGDRRSPRPPARRYSRAARRPAESPVGQVDDRRREVDLAVEPGLHDVAVRGRDIDQMVGQQRADMARDELVLMPVVGELRHDQHQRQARAAIAPPSPAPPSDAAARGAATRRRGRARRAVPARRLGERSPVDPVAQRRRARDGATPGRRASSRSASIRREFRAQPGQVLRCASIAAAVGGVELAVDAGRGAAAALSGQAVMTAPSCAVDRAAAAGRPASSRARARRDITVPIGTPVELRRSPGS